MSKEKVSIIIITCAVEGYLKSCLDSVNRQSYREFETIVVDNSLNINFSRDIIERYPGIKLYPQDKNISYCQALNLGINVSSGDFVLCLNDDVILDNRFIEEALKGFPVDNKIGMVSGKIMRSDRETLDSTGLILSCYRTAKERGYGLKDKGKFEKSGFIFGVSGAAALYRKEMLEDIKEGKDYFDPDYHFFYEDLDIAWRANRSGWKGYYMPGAICFHVRGGSVRKKSGINKPYARRYLSDELHSDLIKNRYLTMIKNESGLRFILHLPCMLLYELLQWAFCLLFRPKVIKILISNSGYLKAALDKRRLARR